MSFLLLAVESSLMSEKRRGEKGRRICPDYTASCLTKVMESVEECSQKPEHRDFECVVKMRMRRK